MCLFQNGVIFHRGDQEDGGAQVCMHLHYSVDLLGAPSGGMWLHFFKWGSAPKRLLKGERALAPKGERAYSSRPCANPSRPRLALPSAAAAIPATPVNAIFDRALAAEFATSAV